jgi:initiation factor 1A
MPRQKKGGINNTRIKKKWVPIEYANSSNGELYGEIEEALGSCHFKVIINNTITKVASLCGSVKKGGKVKTGDIVLIQPLSNSKYQIIFKYLPDHRKTLEKEGIISASTKTADTKKPTEEDSSEEEDNFEFGDPDAPKQLDLTQSLQNKELEEMREEMNIIDNI